MDPIQLLLAHLVVIGGCVVIGAIATVSAHAKARLRAKSKTMTVGAAWLLSVLLATGCSKSSGRLPVKGEVALEGKAIQSGSIVFYPLQQGPKVGTKIKDGHYRFTRDNGPVPGRYKVEIYADDSDPFPLDDPRAFTDQMEQDPERLKPGNSIPTQYNKKSILTAEPSRQNLEINFNLEGTDEI